jgi:tetratricopeptide (TPR) repeat protein
MAFDKAKTLRAAEKNLEMGKIPAAIKEYCRIIESEPDDFTTLNILGDLHARVGNQADAIHCFRRIADHYREQDFGLKAIAMFKKIDRLKSNDVEIATTLADLYAQQDLIVEARAHYLVVANIHTKSGATKAGLEVLRKIADLDPQNVEVRIKLAESQLQEGMTREAAGSFTEAGNSFLARGALDEALELFARSLKVEPADYDTFKSMLAAHRARGTADEAAEIIAHALEQNPDDVALMSMLAQAYVEAEDPEPAERAMAALIEREPSAYLKLLEVAQLYLQSNQIDDAVRVLVEMCEQLLAHREDARLLEFVNELLSYDADNVQALRLLVRVHSWNRDAESLKSALERLAEAAQSAGLDEEERYALTQLTRLAPDRRGHAERLRELGGPQSDAEQELLSAFESIVAPAVAASKTEFVIETEDSSGDLAALDSFPDTPPESAAEMEIERGFACEAMIDEQSLSEPADLSQECNEAQADRHAALRAQELESVDFYIEQGYVDIAVDTLNLLENQFGKHADIDLRRARLAAPENGAADAVNDAQADIESAFAELERIPNGKAHDDLESVPAPGAQVIDPGLAEVFEEYRVSAEGDPNGNGDFETHYNLGLAYKEMDLFEEALEEFQLAVKLVSPDDGTPRYLQCCNLLGHCFMQNGVPQVAVKWFQKGLDAPHVSEDERQALRFDLAAAHEQAGEFDRAVDLFTEVYGTNVAYRGVNERLKALQARIAQ